jgi:hypothetical protein
VEVDIDLPDSSGRQAKAAPDYEQLRAVHSVGEDAGFGDELLEDQHCVDE